MFEFLFDGNSEMEGDSTTSVGYRLDGSVDVEFLTEKSFSFPIPLNNLGNFVFTLRALLVSFQTVIALVMCIKPSLKAIFPLTDFPRPLDRYRPFLQQCDNCVRFEPVKHL